MVSLNVVKDVNKIPLTNNIELILRDFVNLNDTITADIDEEGEKPAGS